MNECPKMRWPWWSTTRWSVALFTLAEVWRLAHSPIGDANWAEAFIVFCILFALPIDGALSKAPAGVVVRAVTGMFGKPAEGATWMADKVVNTPHEWAKGTPDEGIL